MRQAKTQLSELVREVRAGFEIVITDRGKPVAKLVPVGDLPLASRLNELEKRGVIGPPSGRPLPLPPLPLPDGVARRILEEERGTR